MSAASGIALAGAMLTLAWAIVLLRGALFVQSEDAVLTQPAAWPDVVAVVPARDEAAVIERSLGSLLAQDYATGRFAIILVDDGSSDGTAELARTVVSRSASPHRLSILAGRPLAPGWTGKLCAVSQGIAAAGTPKWLWLTDADIAHTPDTLRGLVARAERDRLVLNSRMALLRTGNLAERAIVPAFVYFFRLLYPFGAVNDARSSAAAAAGGCMVIDRAALESAGGVAAIRGALIDDVAMGRLMKPAGPIRLALSHATVSLRASDWHGLWTMIARSAFAQLRFSPWLLAGALVGIVALFWGPVAVVAALPRKPGVWLPLLGMAASFVPMLRFYRQSPLWAAMLPFIALFYAAATLASAIQHWRGRGGMWKGRAQAIAQA